MHIRNTLAPRLVVVAACAAAIATLAACDEPGAAESRPQTRVESTSADPLLAAADLGTDIVAVGDEDFTFPDGLGMECIGARLDAAHPVEQSEVSFQRDSGDPFPSVFNAVERYRSAEDVRALMSTLREEIGSCEDSRETHLGLDLDLDIDLDESGSTTAGVDDRVAMTVHGGIGLGQLSLDAALRVAVASVGEYVTLVGVLDFGDDTSSAAFAQYVDIAERRLVQAASSTAADRSRTE